MAKSQLEFDITANGRQAKKEINEVKKAGVDAAEEIQAKNNEATKAAIGMIAPMAIAVQGLMTLIAGISESIRKFFAQGEAFVEWGKKAEVSAHSVAYLKAEADAAGISAKEFEQAMADLGAGRTTISKLREEWEGLGDSIKTATNAQENFEKLGRTRNFSLFGEAQSNFWGGLTDTLMEMTGFGGRQLSAIQRAAYEGKSFKEAVKEGHKARSLFDGRLFATGVSTERQEEAYYYALAQRQADENATQKRAMEQTALKLAEAEIDDADKERIFKEQTGIGLTAKAIADLAESVKTRDQRLNDEIKGLSEERKRNEEADKKARDEEIKTRKAYDDLIKKIGSAKGITDYQLEQIFTEFTGETKTATAIRQMAQDLKTREERLQESLTETAEANKDADERIKKAREADAKEASELTKLEASIKDVFTQGGGLISGVNYGTKFGDWTQEQLKQMQKQIELAQTQIKQLERINSALEE